jgi:UDP-N-acetylglucosamine acyltransferase
MNPSRESGAARAGAPSLADIHSTAIIHPRARLGVSVGVGPYSIIGENVVIGDRCRIGSCARIEGHLEMGPGNEVHHGAVLGSPPQDLKYRGGVSRVRIGEGNVFREFVTVNVATGEGEATVIGSHCLLMAYVHVAHNCILGDHVILANSVNMAGHVEIQDHAIVGGVTPIHQFVRIGAHSFIGGGSRIPQDVPPFVKVAGNPPRPAGLNSVGLERRDFPPEVKRELQKVYRIFYRCGLNTSQALDRVREECLPLDEVRRFVQFVQTSLRGVTR